LQELYKELNIVTNRISETEKLRNKAEEENHELRETVLQLENQSVNANRGCVTCEVV
jgi:hypothetical protein